jgi:hypothetical protein
MKASLQMFVLSSLLVLGVASLGQAELQLPGTVNVEGKSLKLNGSGVRKKSVFRIKVYIASLYLETGSANPEQILAADRIRRLDLLMTHSAPKQRVIDELRDGISQNSPAQMKVLADRLERFLAGIPDANEGERLSITYVPGQGTSLKGPKTNGAVIPGKDFADAVLSAWLGKAPLDEELKQHLLGRP